MSPEPPDSPDSPESPEPPPLSEPALPFQHPAVIYYGPRVWWAFCFDEMAALEYTQTAFRLGREALWEYTRIHHPEFHRRLSKASPLFIRASQTEFEYSTIGWSLAPELKPALLKFKDLRNFVSHPCEQGELSSYAEEADKGLYLLKMLGDEARIQQFRAARDALRTQAEQTFTEIQDRGALLYDLQGDYVEDVSWDRRHTAVSWRSVTGRARRSLEPKSIPIHPAISRAAEAWQNLNSIEREK
ncbi:uncharacterized protein B0H64DRAFT_440906 [Chaetomium fimeti]|uniref:Uncharacterized protein n=1 Tax=Chaetomium fimeti TaxID=1854472 RepID=A0AAE0HJ21_9PEZI|nr:hypothetical protein B0H64DRAFT_440906 [Chaetomium fimeti]